MGSDRAEERKRALAALIAYRKQYAPRMRTIAIGAPLEQWTAWREWYLAGERTLFPLAPLNNNAVTFCPMPPTRPQEWVEQWRVKRQLDWYSTMMGGNAWQRWVQSNQQQISRLIRSRRSS